MRKESLSSLLSIIGAILIITIILSSPVRSAQQQTSSNTMQIEFPKYDFIKLGNDHRFHVHVINSTNIKTNKTTQCLLHLYNQTGYDLNNSQWMEFEDYNGIDFALTITANNFSLGEYNYVVECNSTGEVAFASGTFEVNNLGKALPTDVVLIFFYVVYLGILGFFIYLLILTFTGWVTKKFDIWDVAKNIGAYFVLVAFYILELNQLNDPTINFILDTFVIVGAFTHVLFSIILFMIIWIFKAMAEKKLEMGLS